MGEKLNILDKMDGRVCDPSGPGFPPLEYNLMRLWGEEGRGTLRGYLDRPLLGFETLGQSSGSLLRDAAAKGPGELASAGERVVENIRETERTVRLQTAQGAATLRALHAEGTIPPPELLAEARGGARRLKTAVTQHVSPLETLMGEVFSQVQDNAVDAVAAKAEQAVNSLGKTAYEQMEELHAWITSPAGTAT